MGWVRFHSGLTGRSSAPITSQLRTLRRPVREPTVGIDHELAKARRLYVIKHCPAAIGRSPLENGVLAARRRWISRPNEGAPPFDALGLYRIRRTPSGVRDSGRVTNV